MLPFAYFLLKVTICSAVLFCYYWFFLRNKIFHAYNRFYLLAIVALSLTLPICRINVFHKAEAPKTNMIKMLQVITIGDEFMDDTIITTEKKNISFADLATLFYLTISAVFLMMLLQMLLHIRSLKKHNENTIINDIHFVNTDNGKGTPFSFFKFIFWNQSIDINTPAGKRIFRHELAHIQERHSWDKMFINIILILFWCNPIFWFIRRELSMIHEFIADKRAVEDGDTAAFASMILAASYPQHRFTITNNFFYSPIKRRLMMLTKIKNVRTGYISRLLVLPVLVFLFAAFTLKAKEIGADKKIKKSFEQIINNINGIKSIDTKSYDDATHSKNVFTDSKITVVIDAGHGGTDGGAKNKNGIFEKDVALQLIKKIAELNTNENIKIILSRTDDVFFDPKQKAAFAKAQNPDLFISVHLDNTPKEKWNTISGMSVFVARNDIENSGKSKVFASSIINAFKNNYSLNVPTTISQRDRGIWILQANHFPSVLIEAGYLTNDIDAAYLQSKKGQETFAINVLNAIKDFAGSKDYSSATPKNNYSDTIGYYKGKAVVGVTVRPSTNVATITYTDNSKESITLAQANVAHLLPPPPPPAAILKGYKSVYTALDPAGEYKNKAVISTNTINEEFITLGYADGSFEKITVKEAMEGGLKTIYSGKISTDVPFKSSNKIPEVSDENRINQNIEPVFRVGNLTNPKVSTELFKKEKFVTVTDEYEFVEATVWFSGAGFANVISATLVGNHLKNLKPFIDRCVAGTNVTFDNIRVKDHLGFRTINGKAYSLF